MSVANNSIQISSTTSTSGKNESSTSLNITSSTSSKWGFLSGGTMFDAFLMEASQQIGQSILTLPWIFANMGFTLGTICLILVTCASMWTQHLLISLYTEYKKDIDATLPDKEGGEEKKKHITSYHEVITWAAGPWWGNFSRIMVILALGGLSVVQIVSTSSNLYLLDFGLDKRTLSVITGAIVSLVCFIPTYREYRAFTFFGLIATTYTAWYMVTASVIEGPAPDVKYEGPTSLKMFFTCFSSMIFMFGTHSAVIEKADVMNKPSRYDVAYVFAMMYVYTITIPNAITGYHTYGSLAATTSNAFALYPDNVYRKTAISLMCLHELVAFGLFAGPLFHMIEKSLNIDHKGYWICTSTRFILVAFMLLIAVAFPFFGPINGIIGAFTTSFATYIIPSIVYNMHYDNKEKYEDKAKSAWFGVNFNIMKIINWIIIVSFFVLGFCIGGYSTIVRFVDLFESTSDGFFAKCYNC